MDRSISLAVDIDAEAPRVYEALSTTAGQRAFWTVDCDVSNGRARFGFPEAPMDLEVDVTTEETKLVRMTVTAGFPFWEGSTWEWALGDAARAPSGTGVHFRHYGFGAGYSELDLGHTAQTWAMILDRLDKYVTTGKPAPFFPAAGV
jgi:uncharacterized protein YndB with AHSA1/START domain